MNGPKMMEIVKPHDTIAGKIRALAKAGHSKSDIARFLNRSYQQVRHVLMLEEARITRERKETAENETEHSSLTPDEAEPIARWARLEFEADGAIRLPVSISNAMGLRPGDVLMACFQDDELVIMHADVSNRRAQELVRAFIPEGVNLADELIADRRREAENE